MYEPVRLFSLRDNAYLFYILYLTSTTLLVAQYSGIATRYLWPMTPAWNILAFWAFILTGTIAYLGFIRKFLKTKQITPKIDRVILYFGAVLLVALLALFVLDPAFMITNIPILASIGFSLSGVAIVNAIKNGNRSARYVGLANIIFICGMIWASILMFGYPIKLFEWNYFIFVFGILIEAILLSLALASRIKQLQQETLTAQQDLLSNKQHFSKQLIASQDTQRKRIASELHDGIGQNLMVVNNRLHRILDTDLPQNLAKQLDFAHSITQQTIHDLRGLSHLLHPHQLDRLGLATAIETMANETLSDAGIQLTCQTDEIDQLVNKDQSLHIYRIVQEAINNIVRHAQADQVSLSIGGEKQMIYLNINDSGCGIDATWFAQKDFSQAFGLSSIQERVHLMSGTFDMFNAMPHGITLAIKIPLKQV